MAGTGGWVPRVRTFDELSAAWSASDSPPPRIDVAPEEPEDIIATVARLPDGSQRREASGCRRRRRSPARCRRRRTRRPAAVCRPASARAPATTLRYVRRRSVRNRRRGSSLLARATSPPRSSFLGITLSSAQNWDVTSSTPPRGRCTAIRTGGCSVRRGRPTTTWRGAGHRRRHHRPSPGLVPASLRCADHLDTARDETPGRPGVVDGPGRDWEAKAT